jgi:hypothetical protein
VVTLGEAATRAAGGSRQALTSDVLDSLNQDDPSLLAVDRVGGASVVESTFMNPDKLKMSATYLAQMAKVGCSGHR